MKASEKGQVSGSAAEVYEKFFVPALFGPWCDPVLDRASLPDDGALLDVACGTGALARAALARMGSKARVVGLDRNPGMLAVASKKSPAISWKEGMAEKLPFEDEAFDSVVSNFGLTFFEDRIAALGEMYRVLAPGGRLVIAVWGPLADAPGYAALTRLLRDLFGAETSAALEAPFALGTRSDLMQLLLDADLTDAEVESLTGEARFPSLKDWIHSDVKGWTLADMIDEQQFRTLQAEAARRLSSFVMRNGQVRFQTAAHLVSLTK